MNERYYKYRDEAIIGDGIRYVEAVDGVAIREVTEVGDILIGSNIKYPGWSMMLSEGDSDYDSIEEVEAIEKSEFDRVWRRLLESNVGRWAFTKAAYTIGARVGGHLVVFYPQGAIVDFRDGALGIADYGACKASTEWQNMYPGHRVTAIVAGYDEDNQWVLLAQPQVHSESKDMHPDIEYPSPR